MPPASALSTLRLVHASARSDYIGRDLDGLRKAGLKE